MVLGRPSRLTLSRTYRYAAEPVSKPYVSTEAGMLSCSTYVDRCGLSARLAFEPLDFDPLLTIPRHSGNGKKAPNAKYRHSLLMKRTDARGGARKELALRCKVLMVPKRHASIHLRQREAQDNSDDRIFRRCCHIEPAPVENFEHRSIFGHYVGDKFLKAGVTRDLRQVPHQGRAKTLALKVVGHDEGDFGPTAVGRQHNDIRR